MVGAAPESRIAGDAACRGVPAEPWHDLGADRALVALGTTANGLTEADAADRLARFGRNALRSTPPESAWRILGRQLRSLVVLLLAVASLGALALGERLDVVAIVIQACALLRTPSGDVPLDEERSASLLAWNEELAGEGLRVLALATGIAASADATGLGGLTIVGLVGMEDPPAPGVEATVRRFRGAGIRTVMLTGDQLITAEAVGRSVGVLQSGDESLDARALATIDDHALLARLASVRVLSRVSPEDKLLVAGLVGLPAPLLPLQVLWLNLITDTFPALALALEPAEPELMSRPPRSPDARLLSGSTLGAVAAYAGLITVVTLAALLIGLANRAHAADAVTMSFTTLALAQVFHLGNARSRSPVVHATRALENRYALGAAVVALALQVLAVASRPLGAVLGTRPLDLTEWMIVLLLAAVPAVFGQLWKSLASRRSGVGSG